GRARRRRRARAGREPLAARPGGGGAHVPLRRADRAPVAVVSVVARRELERVGHGDVPAVLRRVEDNALHRPREAFEEDRIVDASRSMSASSTTPPTLRSPTIRKFTTILPPSVLSRSSAAS